MLPGEAIAMYGQNWVKRLSALGKDYVNVRPVLYNIYIIKG